MEPSINNQTGFSKAFLLAALGLLIAGMLFGLTGGLQYIIPGFLKGSLSFEKVRPLHVSSMVFWIIIGAMGTVLTYVQEHNKSPLKYPLLVKIQFCIFLTTLPAILVSYGFGVFVGREYWEFHPAFSLPLIAGWILFIINFIGSVKTFRNQPVYVWMWLTGLFFFLFTYLESYLWIFPFFRNDLVKDMTIQWKSYGSMVGSWNMLVYGSSIYLLDKIAGNKKYSYSKMGFGLYFLGLFNLMFNWGHHIYTLPAQGYIKHIAYAVSMTEIFLLGRILFLWRKSLSQAKKNFHLTSYRFLAASEAWIFLTLGLAIAMSVPALNVFMHGTHIIVAHTMGATIGINSMLLLAFAYDILGDTCRPFAPFKKSFSFGYWLVNISLFVFWIALIIAGLIKANWQMRPDQVAFGSMMKQLAPYLLTFVLAGFLMFTGFLLVIYPLLKNQIACYFLTRKNKIAGLSAKLPPSYHLLKPLS